MGNIPVSSPTILADRNDGGKSAVLTALAFLLGGHRLTDEDRTYVQTEGDVGGRCSQAWVEGVFTLDAGEVDVLGRAGFLSRPERRFHLAGVGLGQRQLP
ncbi:hypothetical protein [Streptomyces sp. NPDC005281]|uniref:hypothetical protein n=1 Tax=Streptomyces sp. NPDC005281 TaxID=3155712 RepID=UPI0033BB0080